MPIQKVSDPLLDSPGGVPEGGTTGQVLAKTSDADLATGWVEQSVGSASEWTKGTIPGSVVTAGGRPAALLVGTVTLAAGDRLNIEAVLDKSGTGTEVGIILSNGTNHLRLTYQGDGNLVLYHGTATAMNASNTGNFIGVNEVRLDIGVYGTGTGALVEGAVGRSAIARSSHTAFSVVGAWSIYVEAGAVANAKMVRWRKFNQI